VQIPDTLIESLKKARGFLEESFIKVHESSEHQSSIRTNPLKWRDPEEIQMAFPGLEPVPWSSFGHYLKQRPVFTFDPLFHAGTYYVQEASSMFIEQALRNQGQISKPINALDLCAAPGGKSTLFQSILSPDSLMVSNEVIRTRVPILTENLNKWGAMNFVVTQNDPSDFGSLEEFFDLLLIDAPCSGSGLFRREPELISEWSPSQVQLCSRRQQRIITDALPALKSGGLLIYSTCSYSVEENEEILDWMAESFELESLRIPIDPDWKIFETQSTDKSCFGYRFYPDQVRGEGFFLAAFRKTGSSIGIAYKKKQFSFERISKKEDAVIRPWLDDQTELSFLKKEQMVYALPVIAAKQIESLSSTLYLKKAGICLGKLSSNELLPSPELALSKILNKNIPSLDLGLEDGLRYLRREDLHPAGVRPGWRLVRYKEHGLGWIKVLSNRSNNYYPQEWRIRKAGG
jgi:16S rRNA C967 or C1407 C5-methylase (RsmB/RsmF family)/NOL1/NOP2/fmu family ribosome biogenesis protein